MREHLPSSLISVMAERSSSWLNSFSETFIHFCFHWINSGLQYSSQFWKATFVHSNFLFTVAFIFCMRYIYTGWPNKHGTVDFVGHCSDQQLSFFTLLDRTSFPHYNNTKIIKVGWELFILWVISYGLSFSGFAINLSLIELRNSGNRANPENDSQ